MLITIVSSFLIGFIPLNKLYINCKRINYFYYSKYFNIKDISNFLETEYIVNLILLYFLKPTSIWMISNIVNIPDNFIWVPAVTLVIGNKISNDIIKFRGTLLILIYIFLMNSYLSGCFLAFYLFLIVFFRSQAKASAIILITIVGCSFKIYSLSNILIILLGAIIILNDYYILKNPPLNILTIFYNKNRI